MTPGRPHATLRPAEVVRALQEARERLLRARSNCEDSATMISIGHALKFVTEATSRAVAVRKHVDLLEAEQPPLFPIEGG